MMCYTKENYSVHFNNYRLVEEDDVFSQDNFFIALDQFLNSPIEENLKSENTIIKILCLIDRRVGKRTLQEMQKSILEEHEIIRYFYRIRCQVEGIWGERVYE